MCVEGCGGVGVYVCGGVWGCRCVGVWREEEV